MSVSATRFYVTGGTLPHDAVSYVSRQADTDLLEGLRAGEFCYVLDTRQMGKSSLMVRTAARLMQEGTTVLVLDLTALGQNVTTEQWYDGLLHQLGRELDREDEVDDFRATYRHLGPLQRWMLALREVALVHSHGPLAVFIDEIDIVRSLPFSTDEFFAGIRECYNQRAHHPELCRLTFCLLGVATPDSLIRDTRVTPFNIGRRIELRDFSPEEAAPLALGMDRQGSGAALLRRILWWTGGHPYLTQRLCQAMAEAPLEQTRSGVDRACSSLFLLPAAHERDSNLLFVRDRLLRAEPDVAATLDLYAQVRSGRRIRSDGLPSTVVILLLAGIVRADSGRLRVRNRIYEHVFDRSWVLVHLPDAERVRQRAAYRRGLMRASSLAATVVFGFAALALTAVTYAQRAQKSRLDADIRTVEAQAAVGRANRLKYQADTAAADALREKRGAREAAHLAETLRIEADREKGAALVRTRESLERSGRLMVAYGARLQDEGDLYGSLLWYAQAARLDAADPSHQRIHRLRLAATLHQVPRLGQMWFDAHSAQFSPDGTRVLLAGHDGAARICDAVTGVLRVGPMRHGAELRQALYNDDGRRAVTLGGRRAQVWDTDSGKPVGAPILCKYPIAEARFSSDGRHILFLDGELAELFDATTGRYRKDFPRLWTGTYAPRAADVDAAARGAQLAWLGSLDEIVYPKLGRINGVAFRSDGKRVLAACNNDAAVFDAATGQILTPHLVHPGDPLASAILTLGFSPDGQKVVTGSRDYTARVWNAETGQPVTPPLTHRSFLVKTAFSPDSRRVATASDDMTARVWDAATGRPLTPPIPHSAPVGDVSFDASGTHLLTMDAVGVARTWDIAGLEEPDRLVGEFGNVATATFSPDGRYLATGDFDYSGRVWDSATGQPVGPTLDHSATVRTVAFSPDSRRIATGSDDHQVRVWEIGTGRRLVNLAHRGGVYALAFSPDGKRLLTAALSTAFLWDVATGQQIATLTGHTQKINRVAFSPDGKRLLTASDNGTVRIRDAVTGKLQRLLRLDGFASDAGFHESGRYVFTGSSSGRIQLWDIARGTPARPPIQSLSFTTVTLLSPNGRKLLTASGLGEAQLWDTATGRSQGIPMRHRAAIQSASFSPDSTLIVTSSRDFTARVWDATTGQPVTPPLHHDSHVRQAMFSPDGQRLLTTCDDGQSRLWQLPVGGQAPETLQPILEMLSSRRVEPGGGQQMLTVNELKAAWRATGSALQRGYGPTEGQRNVWHLQQAVADLDDGAVVRATQQLDRLVAATPADRQARALRLSANARQGRWREVAADSAVLSAGGAWLMVLESHRPIARSGTTLSCNANHKILVVTPAPACRFVATARVLSFPDALPTGDYQFTVRVADKSVFASPTPAALASGIPFQVPLKGATAFVLEARHTGKDGDARWIDGQIELEDGRTLRLANLPLRTLGGL